MIDGHGWGGRIVGDRVVGAGRGVVAIAAGIQCNARGDSSDHGSIAGHAADSHIVGGAIHRRGLGDGSSRCPGCAGEGHIAGCKAGDQFAEDHREVDRAGTGWVNLSDCLIDGYGWSAGVVGYCVVSAGGSGIVVSSGILRFVDCNGGNDGTIANHSTDGHIVGGAIHRRDLSDCACRCSGCSGKGHIARCKAGYRFTKDHGEVDRVGTGRVSLSSRLVDSHGWCNIIICHRIVSAGGTVIRLRRQIGGDS